MGGQNFDTHYDINFSSQVNNNYFAYAEAGLGDVNLDGVDDFMIGDFNYANNKGKSFLYADESKTNNTPTQIFTGDAAGYKEGIAIAGAGDVNGDGYKDIIVGAEGAPNGQAKIIFGSDSFNENYDLLLEGQQAGSYFGQCVSSAGDFNGDGFADVIVGAYKEDNNTGKVYLYYGGSNMNNSPDITFTGNTSLTRFGFSISSIGDMNKDGYSDIIIGAPDEGKAYCYFGGESPDTNEDFIFSASEVNFGGDVAGVGDVNGDTYLDILIGSIQYNGAKGRAYLYYGKETLVNYADVIFESQNEDLNFGVSVASAGDVNADGYSDLVIGARGTDNFTGRTYFY